MALQMRGYFRLRLAGLGGRCGNLRLPGSGGLVCRNGHSPDPDRGEEHNRQTKTGKQDCAHHRWHAIRLPTGFF